LVHEGVTWSGACDCWGWGCLGEGCGGSGDVEFRWTYEDRVAHRFVVTKIMDDGEFGVLVNELLLRNQTWMKTLGYDEVDLVKEGEILDFGDDLEERCW